MLCTKRICGLQGMRVKNVVLGKAYLLFCGKKRVDQDIEGCLGVSVRNKLNVQKSRFTSSLLLPYAPMLLSLAMAGPKSVCECVSVLTF
jgi:hypothetical protein